MREILPTDKSQNSGGAMFSSAELHPVYGTWRAALTSSGEKVSAIPPSFSANLSSPSSIPQEGKVTLPKALFLGAFVKAVTMPITFPWESMARSLDTNPAASSAGVMRSFSLRLMLPLLGGNTVFKVFQGAVRDIILGPGYDATKKSISTIKEHSPAIADFSCRYPAIEKALPTLLVSGAVTGMEAFINSALANILLPLEKTPSLTLRRLLEKRFAGGVKNGVKSFSYGMGPMVLAQANQWLLYLMIDDWFQEKNKQATNRVLPTPSEQVLISSKVAASMAVCTVPLSTVVGRMQAKKSMHDQALERASKLPLDKRVKDLVPYIKPVSSMIETCKEMSSGGVGRFFNPPRMVQFFLLYIVSSATRQYLRGGFAEHSGVKESSEIKIPSLPSSCIKDACINDSLNIVRSSEETCPFARQ